MILNAKTRAPGSGYLAFTERNDPISRTQCQVKVNLIVEQNPAKVNGFSHPPDRPAPQSKKEIFMKRKTIHTVSQSLGEACLVRHLRPKRQFAVIRAMRRWLFTAFVLAFLTVSGIDAQLRLTNSMDVNLPFETRAPWFNRDRTAVVDEVVVRGTLHMTGGLWSTTPTHIDRMMLHINVVDIKGTSETTGQRYRVHGTWDMDVRDPDIQINPDGTFPLPLDGLHLSLRKVDPEPSQLYTDMDLRDSGSSAWAVNTSSGEWPPTGTPCTRVINDGVQTDVVDCGNVKVGVLFAPIPYNYHVWASIGGACGPTNCEAPDGATLFNGYAGDYRPPLVMSVRTWVANGNVQATLDWHCKTGEWEAPVTIVAGDNVRCSPIYSPLAPIKLYADITYRYPWGAVIAVPTQLRTYHMLERPVNNPPVIDAGSFSVKATTGPSAGLNARCLPLIPCNVLNGDVLFNGNHGDFVPPLYMHLNASDPDGDPVFVRWQCVTGGIYQAAVTDLGNGLFTCDPLHSFNDASVSVYAVVSDGTLEVSSEVRTLLMPGA